MADCADGKTIEDMIFDDQNIERSPWPVCGHKVPRSELVFFTQVFLIFAVIVFCIFRLSVSRSCEEMTVYIAILTSTVTYLLPPPNKTGQ